MDARITKQRLGVLLSYDWLKILGAIAVAVVAIYVLFLILTAQPTIAQVYTVYTYGGLNIGTDSGALVKKLKGSFSYDIVDVEMENFGSGSMGEQALTARRGVLEGDAVLAANYTEGDGLTPFEQLCVGYGSYVPARQVFQGFYDIPTLLQDAKAYLSGYFDDPATAEDETLTREEPIASQVEAAFYRKNSDDKRFKTDAQKAAGIAKERERAISLRQNFLSVTEAFESGSLYLVPYCINLKNGAGEETTFEANVGVGLGNLTGLRDLFYYYEGGKPVTENVVLVFFDNGYRTEDTKYENLAFLCYLLKNYAPVHS